MNLSLTLHGTQRQLPLVLCGPMLRRVTPDSVTVWVALHSACSIQLIVLDFGGVIIFKSDHVETIKIGEYLHIACVTAKAKAPGEYLGWNNLYHYDLEFTINNASHYLSFSKICREDTQTYKDDFCYGEDYPSFVMPPEANNLEHLRIVHGSCRKPHGIGLDALSCLDTLINDNLKNPPMRPQLLCLTGDQIYADEVDDSLMSIIQEVAEKLLTGISPIATTSGDRSELMRIIGFTSGESRNHLIAFSEFVAMYLLVWSDELWPLDISTAAREVQGFRKRLPAVRRALANIPTYMVFDDHEITDDWNRTKNWRTKTYYEDFNDGPNSAAKNYAAHTIIANGLLAYAFFQGWGNLGDNASSLPTYYGIFDIIDKQSSPTCKDPVTLFDLQSLMLPTTVTNGNWTYLEYPNQEMPWSFRIDYPGFQLIGLDSRNLRGYRDGINAPAVIYPGSIPPQLGNDYSKPLTIVMCAAPLFGVEAIESVQEEVDIHIHFHPFWKLDPKLDEKYDKEAWSFDSEAFYTIQLELSKFKKIIVLSGDVHYGFSVKVEYWGEQITSPPTAIFAQCCSSALQNSNSDIQSFIMRLGSAFSITSEKVWVQIPLTFASYLVSKKYFEDEIKFQIPAKQQLRMALFHNYDLQKGIDNINTLGNPFLYYLEYYTKLFKYMRSALVINPNIGLIYFSGNYLHHELITPMPNAPLSAIQKAAIHIIDFQLPDPADKPIQL